MRARPQTVSANDPLWYKDAIVYQLHVKAFFDADGDGIGDFRGLTDKLDYLADLGVTALWLLPFYPSPLRDDGYDVSDYKGVHESYGTLRDAKRFIDQAHARGMRVITELVVNHTSDQHPWFQRARNAKKGSAARDFYVWSDTDDKYAGTRIIFTDTEVSNWTWDPVAKQYYWHRFFSHQPDLNFDNPRVFKAVADVMRFWLDLGVDGLRLDAVPYLCEREGTSNENLPETHDVLKRLRAIVDREYSGRMLLAEANQWPEDVRAYFGDGDECHMAFHFPLMPRMYMAVAQEDRYPVYDIMRQTPEIPANAQWAIFLRNHDEMTLEMVTDAERSFMYSVYASEARARINVGIRRRLAPLMDNDRRKIELLTSMLFSMPGTPVIYYGDEIGMGDNIFLRDRDGVRTPMQWSPDRNGGFSRADTQRLFLPPVQDPIYGFNSVNVESQQRSPSSLLNWLRRIVTVRQSHKVFGRGTITFLYPNNRHVIAYTREYEGETVLCVANLSRSSQAVTLDLARYANRTPVEMIDWSTFPTIIDDRYVLTLPGYAFFWFLLSAEVTPTQAPASVPPEFITLVLRDGWNSLFEAPALGELERSVLPSYVASQAWYRSPRRLTARGDVVDEIALDDSPNPPYYTIVDALDGEGRSERYSVPMSLAASADAQSALVSRAAFARVRRGPRDGVLYDGVADDRFWLRAIEGLRGDAKLTGRHGVLVFSPTWSLDGLTLDNPEDVRRMQEPRNNNDDAAVVDNSIALRLYRQIEGGPHPEIEMGRYLHESAFQHAPPLLGTIEYVAEDGTPYAVGVAHRFVENQGDGWRMALRYLERFIDRRRAMASGEPTDALAQNESNAMEFEVYERSARAVGRVLAALHRTLAEGTTPEFAPEPFEAADLERLTATLREGAERALETLRAALATLPTESLREQAQALLDEREGLLAAIERRASAPFSGMKTRIHGRFHLGNVIVTDSDVLITGFDGDRRVPFPERRRKALPLEDVAGVLQSFDYAEVATLFGLTLDRKENLEPFAPELAELKRRASEAFLSGYEREAKAQVPRSMLELFVLDRALYSVRYEMANRPSWIAVPLRTIRSLIHDGSLAHA